MTVRKSTCWTQWSTPRDVFAVISFAQSFSISGSQHFSFSTQSSEYSTNTNKFHVRPACYFLLNNMPFISFVSFWGKNQRSSWILCSSCPINRRDIRHNSKTSHNFQGMPNISSTGKHSWVRDMCISSFLKLTKLWFWCLNNRLHNLYFLKKEDSRRL